MPKIEKHKRWLIFCEPCTYKRILNTDQPEDMVSIKVSPVPGKIPQLNQPNQKLQAADIDKLTAEGWQHTGGDGKSHLVFTLNGQNKILVFDKNEWKESVLNLPMQKQCSKVKCPQCGRGVVIKALPDVYAKSYDEIDAREAKAREDADKRRRIEDGIPIRREKDPDFLG